jgi:hypothetical protein
MRALEVGVRDEGLGDRFGLLQGGGVIGGQTLLLIGTVIALDAGVVSKNRIIRRDHQGECTDRRWKVRRKRGF